MAPIYVKNWMNWEKIKDGHRAQLAVKDEIKTAGSERELKLWDAIHLPFHQVGMSENLHVTYLSEADVP